MILTLLLMCAAAAATATYFIVSRRRHTSHVQLDMASLPLLESGLAELAGLTGGSVHFGNRARLFQNGALFEAMARDIRAARHTVHLETFVWSKGALERRFVDLLSAKAVEGVKVRTLIDAMGGVEADSNELQRLRRGGADVMQYCRPHWWNLRRMNHRTHRKLLIVDGAIGYTCGHGIADTWLGDGQDKDHWRDTGVRLEGPVVHAMQTVFMENWIEESRCVPSGEGCFPELGPDRTPLGKVHAHVVSSDSGEAISSVALLYTVAIACARREVIIQNPYFVPGDGVVKLLGTMVERGVAVHLMVPGAHTDNPFVRRAGCHLYAGLMRAGVRLYEFLPSLLHQKIVVIDGVWSHIGSTNFDARSLALNEEVGIGLLDRDIAAELKAAFENDLRSSRELSLAQWNRRPWYRKAADWMAYQVHEQL